MRSAVDVVREFVEAFIQAWPAGDADTLAAFFSEDAVYNNGPFEPVIGRAAIVASLASFMAMGGDVSVDLLHLVADGEIVLTERIDYVTAGGKTMSLPIMGAFEVRGGLIAAWRDYFDPSQFTSQAPNEG